MGRNLRYIGLAMLAATAWMLIAGEAEWLKSERLDMFLPTLAGVGAVSFGLGVLLSFLAPAGRKLLRGRCARCGTPIERGQSYCLDHLRETVGEYQERARRRDSGRPGRRI
jgi:hypothetical protein